MDDEVTTTEHPVAEDRSFFNPLAIIAVLLLVALLAWWVFAGNQSSTSSSNNQNNSPISTQSATNSATP